MSDFNKALAFQQAKTIHRLLRVLADDLGDLSIERGAKPVFGELADEVSGVLEPAMQCLRDKIGKECP